MSDALRKPAIVQPRPRPNAVGELFPPVRPARVNDNEAPPAVLEGEQRLFEIPAAIWRAMVACYAVFLAALLAATGGAMAAFMIAISIGYVAMFFGTARIMARQAPPQPRSPLDRPGGVLQTIHGPLSARAVVAQMLVVPAAVAFFGLAVLVIRIAVG